MRSFKYVYNDIMAFLVSLMIWGSILIVCVVVFIPWESWKSLSGWLLMSIFGFLRSVEDCSFRLVFFNFFFSLQLYDGLVLLQSSLGRARESSDWLATGAALAHDGGR